VPEQVTQETVRELRRAITALSEYTDQQRKKYVTLILVFVLIASIISIGVTTTIVSVCFLSNDRNSPNVCTYIPGYRTSIENGKELERQFRELQKETETNRKKIKELENGR
jgi:hypothetical protein